MTETTSPPTQENVPLLSKACATLRRILPWILVLAAPAMLFNLIAVHQVNFPFLDDWMFVLQFEKEPNGFLWTLAKDDVHLTLHDFFRVQMEHRLAFVRLVVFVLHKLWPTDYTKWMWVGWLVLALTYNNVAILIRRTTGAPFRTWWPLLAMAGLAIFSPLQYRVVLWAMMFQVACPGFFLSAALVVLTSRWPAWLKWIAGVFCASLGTQSLASGLLIWVLPLPLVFWGGAIEGRRAKWIFTAAWMLVFAVTVKLYFTNLVNEEDHAFTYGTPIGAKALDHDVGEFLRHPLKAIPYVMRFLGNPLGRGNGLALMDATLLAGSVSMLLYLAACLYFLVNFRRQPLRQSMLPWLLFGSYSVASGLLVCMGRLYASNTGDNVLASRYIIHAIPLIVSLVALSWIMVRDLQEQKPAWQLSKVLPYGGTAAAIFLLLPWPYGCRLMEMWQSARLRGATTTMFYKTKLRLQEYVPGNRVHAKRANSLRLLDPPMLENTRLDNFKFNPDSISIHTAQWTSTTFGRDKKDGSPVVKIRGYAALENRKRVADGIFFTCRNNTDETEEIIHVEQVAAMPIFLMDLLSRDVQFVHLHGNLKKESVSEFEGQIPLDLLPAGVSDVKAWVFDYLKQQVTRIAGTYRIDKEKLAVERLKDDPRLVKMPGDESPRDEEANENRN